MLTLNLMNDELETLGEFKLTQYGRHEHWLDKDAIANFFGYKADELDILEESWLNVEEENGKKKTHVCIEYTVKGYNDKNVVFTYYPVSTPEEIYVELKDSDNKTIYPTSIEQVKGWGA